MAAYCLLEFISIERAEPITIAVLFCPLVVLNLKFELIDCDVFEIFQFFEGHLFGKEKIIQNIIVQFAH